MTERSPVISDADIREEVLDPGRSFLVQAPAGSGKTELLIQRYLQLLAIVDEPEEVLAITFTRKAAAEMRARVQEALDRARSGDEPIAEYLQTGFRLATAVLDRERERGWQLQTQPSRLRIGTIDSVNTRLARRAPLSAGQTSSNVMIEATEPLYRAAARETIFHAEERDHFGAAITLLLGHCDNRVDRLETLLSRMLARRDQWMPMLASGNSVESANLRDHLQHNLILLIENTLGYANARITSFRSELLDCLTYAGASISIEKPDSELTKWQAVTAFPEPSAEAVALWRSMADVFLTQKGQWRRTLNKNQGFPPDGPQMKARAMKLLQTFRAFGDLESALSLVRLVPAPEYSDEQWSVLEALLSALPLAAANLKQLFFRERQTDFCEIAQEALASLGTEDETTAMSLMLDYQIKHILLDEFQDTSRSQFELIRKMTAGWQEDTGRTLFLVGDPMQSIYRFREAEVGLFLEARDKGIGEVRLEFRQLRTNFRSDPAIVDWFNGVFAQIMPERAGRASERENPMAGAISFAPSTAFNPHGKDSRVDWHVTPYGERDLEARLVVRTIEDTRSAYPDQSIAVLVRSRQHGVHIARHLRTSNIPFASNDLETLEEQPVIQDLLALTRALAHRADRLAWLAVLRAPWCGLTLNDMAALAAANRKAIIWELVEAAESNDAISETGRARIERIRKPLRTGLQRTGLATLRDRVESVWLALGGPATVGEEPALKLADAYFDFLDTLDTGGNCPDNAELLAQLKAWRPRGRATDANLQLMTMHKAKGLEFDTVILPGLGYPTRKDDRPLLTWHELVTTDEVRPLVLAPVHGTGSERDEIFEFLWTFDQHQARLEQDRLLYVAATRARRRLHLFAPLQTSRAGVAEPDGGSLLKRLWPAVKDSVVIPDDIELPERKQSDAPRTPEWFEVRIDRLTAGWRVPDFPPSWRPSSPGLEASEASSVDFDWVSTWAMHVGSVVHEWLQHIAKQGPERFDGARIETLRPEFEQSLRHLGVDDTHLGGAAERVMKALKSTVEDEKGRWILSGQHDESDTELAVTVRHAAGFEQLILDRTFVCEQGQRWIIDYKTSIHEGGNLDGFLSSEAERYKPQLKRYRDVMSQMDDRPIRTALYFPLMQIFHEVEIDS